MSVVRGLGSVSLLCLFMACGGGSGNNTGGGGGNDASLTVLPASSTLIAGGAPLDFTATLVSASGTIAWALSGPGSIDPSSGNVTRYTPPATVASSTTATLTATSGSLTSRATLTVNPPATLTVTGRVVDTVGSLVPGATVSIGSQQATTDTAGAFSISGVTAPYDAAVVVLIGPRTTAIVFMGLTRADPTLIAAPLNINAPDSTGTVSGSVTGGDPLPDDSDRSEVAWGSPDDPQTITALFTENPWSMNFSWPGLAGTSGDVHALQWTPLTGIPTSYKAYGVRTGVVLPSGGTTSGVTIAMTSPDAGTIGGGVTVPAGVNLTGKTLNIDFADGASFTVGTESSASTSFDYPVPTGIGSTASVTAQGMSASGLGLTLTQLRGIASGSTGNVVGLVAPPVPSTPPANATAVTNDTHFTWTSFVGGLHIVAITTNSSAAPDYFLITTGTSAKIPILGTAGVVFPGATVYQWSIDAIGPWESIDAYAGGPSQLPTGGTVINLSFSASARSFTTL